MKYIILVNAPNEPDEIAAIFDDYEEAADTIRKQKKYWRGPWRLFEAKEIASKVEAL